MNLLRLVGVVRSRWGVAAWFLFLMFGLSVIGFATLERLIVVTTPAKPVGRNTADQEARLVAALAACSEPRRCIGTFFVRKDNGMVYRIANCAQACDAWSVDFTRVREQSYPANLSQIDRVVLHGPGKAGYEEWRMLAIRHAEQYVESR